MCEIGWCDQSRRAWCLCRMWNRSLETADFWGAYSIFSTLENYWLEDGVVCKAVVDRAVGHQGWPRDPESCKAAPFCWLRKESVCWKGRYCGMKHMAYRQNKRSRTYRTFLVDLVTHCNPRCRRRFRWRSDQEVTGKFHIMFVDMLQPIDFGKP